MINFTFVNNIQENLKEEDINGFDFIRVSNGVLYRSEGFFENIYDVHKGEYIFKKWVQKARSCNYFLYISGFHLRNVFGISGSVFKKSVNTKFYLINYYAPQFRSYLLENII